MKFNFVFCVLFIWSVSFVSAEYYHYVDKNGVKHYTDDISNIPENLRPDLSEYQSIQSPNKKKIIEKKPMDPKDRITPDFLKIKKSEIDHEYKTLVKKNRALSEQKNELDEKEYNVLATQLNIEIEQYQKKKDLYEKLVEKYNKQITK